MEQNLLGGRIWKGSDAQIEIVLYPRNYSGGASNTKVEVYTDKEVSIEIPEIIESGTTGTIKLDKAQLQQLNDGLIRYTVSYDIDGVFHYVELETKWYLRTPEEFKPVDFVTTDNVKDIVKEEMELEGVPTKEEVEEGDNAVKEWVEEQKYLTESALTDYAKTEDIPTKLSDLDNDSGFITTADTSGYTTMAEVEAKGYLTSASTADMATQTWVKEQGYLTEHQSLSAYSTTEEVENKINDAVSGIPTQFKTINGSAITGEGEITIEGKIYSGGTGILVDNDKNEISFTGVTSKSAITSVDIEVVEDDTKMMWYNREQAEDEIWYTAESEITASGYTSTYDSKTKKGILKRSGTTWAPLGGKAFTSVCLPSGMQENQIKNSLFINCTELTGATLHGQYIGMYMFSGCTALAEINSDTVTTINGGALMGCTSLTKINLPNLTTIDSKFAWGILVSSICSGNTKLTEIHFPSLTQVNVRNLFAGGSLKTIYFESDISLADTALDAMPSGCTIYCRRSSYDAIAKAVSGQDVTVKYLVENDELDSLSANTVKSIVEIADRTSYTGHSWDYEWTGATSGLNNTNISFGTKGGIIKNKSHIPQTYVIGATENYYEGGIYIYEDVYSFEVIMSYYQQAVSGICAMGINAFGLSIIQSGNSVVDKTNNVVLLDKFEEQSENIIRFEYYPMQQKLEVYSRINWYDDNDWELKETIECTSPSQKTNIWTELTTMFFCSVKYNRTDKVEFNIPRNVSELTNDSGYITSVPLSAYSTTSQMNTAIKKATSGIPTTFKTINGSAITGTGNIEISSGADMNNYYTSAQTNTAISNATSGLAKTSDIPTKVSQLDNDSGYITSASTADMATQTWVKEQGYLTEHQSLSAYSTTEEIDNKISGFTTMEAVEAKGYLTEHQSLDGYAKSEDVTKEITSATTDMATQTWVNEQLDGIADILASI